MPLHGESFRARLEKPVSRAAEKQRAKRERDANWLQVRKAVLVRDRYRCRACGSADLVEVHHVRFRSAGRNDSLENCAALCKPCHQEIHAYRLHLVGEDANARLRVERTR